MTNETGNDEVGMPEFPLTRSLFSCMYHIILSYVHRAGTMRLEYGTCCVTLSCVVVTLARWNRVTLTQE